MFNAFSSSSSFSSSAFSSSPSSNTSSFTTSALLSSSCLSSSSSVSAPSSVAQSTSPDVFALLVPGRPLTSAFKVVDKKKMTIVVDNPVTVLEFGLSLLKPSVIPKDYAIAVYYSLSPFKDWAYLGKLNPESPSKIFRSPWSGKISSSTTSLQLGVSIEPKAFFTNLQDSETKELDASVENAQGIANDLFSFMASFSKPGTAFGLSKDLIIVPANILSQWMSKFLAKAKYQPYFWTKPKT
eukprot:TRINITY_DN11732_c0_g1_i1.p1 TRINITY_DN11732_c0_g1~~TRINITY_DN11732_c0_g1_i1.p1  ORF type:complete len:240 (-),score=84.69 TRINITY_DN11732_c0_g1_i1:24-743(-)